MQIVSEQASVQPLQQWRLIPGQAKYLALRGDGKMFAIGEDGALWTRSSRSGEWNQYKAPPLLQISPVDDGAAWAIGDDNIVYFKRHFADGNQWMLVPGEPLISITVSADGAQVWGVTADGRLCHRTWGRVPSPADDHPAAAMGTAWQFPFPGHELETKLQQVSISRDGACLWALGADGEFYNIFHANPPHVDGNLSAQSARRTLSMHNGTRNPFQRSLLRHKVHSLCASAHDGTCWIVPESSRCLHLFSPVEYRPDVESAEERCRGHHFYDSKSPLAWTYLKNVVITNPPFAHVARTNAPLCPSKNCFWNQ